MISRELKVNTRRDYLIIRRVDNELKVKVLADPKEIVLEALKASVNGRSVGTRSTGFKGNCRSLERTRL